MKKGFLGTRKIDSDNFCVETTGVPADFNFSEEFARSFEKVGIKVEMIDNILRFSALRDAWNEEQAIFNRDSIGSMLLVLYWKKVC